MGTEVNKVELRPLIGKDFASSGEFIEQFGRHITRSGMFVPLPDPYGEGKELELKFTLNGGKDILAGTAAVVERRDGANGETPGCEVRFLDLSDRSLKNLDMILSWRQRAGEAG